MKIENSKHEPGTASPVSETSRSPLKIGTRGSRLARRQSDWCAEELRKFGFEVEIVVIRTSGDVACDESIVNIGAQGVFTREIQRALLRGEIDLAVHSLKDLPTEPVDGLTLEAVPRRASYRDVFVCNHVATLDELPEGSRIGTGSLRRKIQIQYRYGDRFRLEEIRGNVETRLEKLDRGDYDVLILAEAGLVRLGLTDRIVSILDAPNFLPAVGQGALGLEIRSNDPATAERIAPLSDSETFAAVTAERAFLRTLQGGCIAPIAALGICRENRLKLHGRILSMDGKTMFETTREAPPEQTPEALGIAAAEELIDRGADSILHEIQQLRRSGIGG